MAPRGATLGDSYDVRRPFWIGWPRPEADTSEGLQMIVARRTRPPAPASAAENEFANSLRLLVVQSCPVTPAGIVGQVAQDRGAQLTTLSPHRGESLPRSTAGFDGLIILGGPMHAGDDAGYPAFPALLALIRRFHAPRKPIFGTCFGAQLMPRCY